MKKSSPLQDASAELARELFSPLGNITLKRLFGGAGVYCDLMFFALIHEGEIYLKVDAATEAQFKQAGSRPFTYFNAKRGQEVRLSYWTLPEEALDDSDCALDWGRLALQSAKAHALKTVKKPK
jgi:DNA transformation protein